MRFPPLQTITLMIDAEFLYSTAVTQHSQIFSQPLNWILRIPGLSRMSFTVSECIYPSLCIQQQASIIEGRIATVILHEYLFLIFIPLQLQLLLLSRLTSSLFLVLGA